MIRWLHDILIRQANRKKHDVVKLNWKKAELEKLLAAKDTMTPEEFMKEYQKLIQ